MVKMTIAGHEKKLGHQKSLCYNEESSWVTKQGCSDKVGNGVKIVHGIGALLSVRRALLRSVVMKLNFKAKLSMYWYIYMLTIVYGHDVLIMTKTKCSLIQAAEMIQVQA